jgi:RND family efflux transporter MFP subunit
MMKLSPTVAGILALCLLAAAAGCGRKSAEIPPEKQPVVQGVKTEQVRVLSVPDRLEAVGTVRSRNTALLAARIPGTVTGITVREGDRVRRGQLLVTLSSTETGASAAAAAAAVEDARRGVDEASSRKRLADITYQRYEKMFQQQAATAQEFDGKRMEREQGEEGVARAEARLKQAREAARGASAVAGYGSVTAPIAGIVTAKPVERGMTVFPGTPLLTVEEEGAFQLTVAAPESLLGVIRPGMAVPVAVDGSAVSPKGTVAEIVPLVDPASRTFTVKINVAAPGLRSGSYGRALFPVGEKKALFVPTGAVVTRGALTSVWTVDGQNIARMRLVKLGGADGGRIEVLSGLADGERIVTDGVEKVTDGAKVQ